VPGIDGEEVPAETIVPDVKEYISETIDDPEAIYDPAIWDTSGFALVLSWLAQKWHQRCHKPAPRGSKNLEQYLTKEQQKACLDSAAAELIREITQGRGSLALFWGQRCRPACALALCRSWRPSGSFAGCGRDSFPIRAAVLHRVLEVVHGGDRPRDGVLLVEWIAASYL
jgi:hypothetical protein